MKIVLVKIIMKKMKTMKILNLSNIIILQNLPQDNKLIASE